MRSLSAACAALAFSVLVGVGSPVEAAIFTDVITGPVTVTSGPGGGFSYTHDVTDDGYIIGTSILGGTLTIEVSNPSGDIQNVQIQFDAGSFFNVADPPATYVFNVDGAIYGGVDIRNEVQTTGQLDVMIRLVGGGAPGSASFRFDRSTLQIEDTSVVPEPASLLLLGTGLLGLAAMQRVRRRDVAA